MPSHRDEVSQRNRSASSKLRAPSPVITKAKSARAKALSDFLEEKTRSKNIEEPSETSEVSVAGTKLFQERISAPKVEKNSSWKLPKEEDPSSVQRIDGFWKNILLSGLWGVVFDLEIMLTATFFAILVIFLSYTISDDVDSSDSSVSTFIHILIAFLSGYRLGDSSKHWWEARDAWQLMGGTLRTLIGRIYTCSFKNVELAETFTILLTTYPFLLKAKLQYPSHSFQINMRNLRKFFYEKQEALRFDDTDLSVRLFQNIVTKSINEDDETVGFVGVRVIQAAQMLLYLGDKTEALHPRDRGDLVHKLETLESIYGTCMKIHGTPVIGQVNGFVRLLYLVALIFHAIDVGTSESWIKGALEIFTMTWLVLTLDAICNDLQNPFSPQVATALPLNLYVKTIILEAKNASVLFKRCYGEALSKYGGYDPNLYEDLTQIMLRIPELETENKVVDLKGLIRSSWPLAGKDKQPSYLARSKTR